MIGPHENGFPGVVVTLNGQTMHALNDTGNDESESLAHLSSQLRGRNWTRATRKQHHTATYGCLHINSQTGSARRDVL